MKKNVDLQKEVLYEIKEDMTMIKAETGKSVNIGKSLKKFMVLCSLAGIALLFNSCLEGFVMTEPSYTVVSVRPPQPTNVHIWIDGDWIWSNQTHVYVQKAGYWEKPRQGQNYVSGHWQASPRGKYWVAGRWQRQNHNHNLSSRNN